MQERRLDQREHDEHVHRAARRQAGRAHFLRDSHAPVDLHAAGIAALHLGEELRRLLLLDDGASNAAQAEIDGERQAGRAGTDDENLGVHSPLCPLFKR